MAEASKCCPLLLPLPFRSLLAQNPREGAGSALASCPVLRCFPREAVGLSGASRSIMQPDPSLDTFGRVPQGQGNGNQFYFGRLAVSYFLMPTLSFKQILARVLKADVVFAQAAGVSL